MTADIDDATRSDVEFVGIGASAGGVQALKDFFSQVPSDSGLAYVVVVHLSPDHSSSLAEVLQPACAIPVQQVQGRVRVEGDQVYVIPPNRDLVVVDGHLDLAEIEEPRGQHRPIDTFLRTLADTHPDSIGVVLSGSGTDGVVGLTAIKEAGGLILAQSPEDAAYDSMPRSAIATGLVDFVLPARELGLKVAELGARTDIWTPPAASEDVADQDRHRLEGIMAQVRARTGHDFSSYKRSTVQRRISRRMQVCGTPSLADYLEHMAGHSHEAAELMRELLVSVTSFFRDPEAFRILETEVIPQLFEGRGLESDVRVWVAGCATGEEAYSIAMLLAEHAAGLPERPRIQIFASDLDEDALAFARDGRYPDAIAADVSPERLQRFFTEEGVYRRVRKELREMVLFSHHSLLRDPPFSSIDLITCRNVLIYLEGELQDRVFRVFHYSLRDSGHLFLGTSENADEHHGFQALSRGQRIYRRVPLPEGARSRLPVLPPNSYLTGWETRPRRGHLPRPSDAAGHLDVFERNAPPGVLLDRTHGIIHVFGSAGRYLDFPGGTPTLNVMKVLKPALRTEFRAALTRAEKTGASVLSPPASAVLKGASRAVRIHVTPVDGRDGAGGMMVVFFEGDAEVGPAGDGTPTLRGQEDTEAKLEQAQDRIDLMIGESEARQEELQAANEELRSINEEYKSTLEELETSKEELQSINEELKTVNVELKDKVDALALAIDDLTNLMAATEIGTLFLDRELRIKRYTPALAELFNVMPVDQGRPLAHLTHSLEYDTLLEDCREVLRSLQPLEREVGAGDGSYFLVRITPYRTGTDHIAGVVVTFTEITRLRRAQLAVTEARDQAEAASRAKGQFLSTLSHELRTPLNAVIGMSDLILEGLAGPISGQQKEYIDRIKASAWYQLSMIEEVLRFTRAEAGQERLEQSDVDVAGVVRDVVEMLDGIAHQRNVALRSAGADPGTVLATDGGKVRQVLTNLVGNALKFTERGDVVVEVERIPGGALVRVRDTGPGIPEERLEQIFEPFFQVDSSFTRVAGGTGLGLAVSRRLTGLFGGELTAANGSDGGAVFTLRVPDLDDGSGHGPEGEAGTVPDGGGAENGG